MKNLKNKKGRTEPAFVILAFAVLVFAMLVVVHINSMRNAPCENFAGFPLESVPIRCVKELTK